MWIHYIMKAGLNRDVVADEYVEFSDEVYGKYIEDDFKGEVEDICDNQHQGYQYSRGYHMEWYIVENPSEKWLKREVCRLEMSKIVIENKIKNYKFLI